MLVIAPAQKYYSAYGIVIHSTYRLVLPRIKDHAVPAAPEIAFEPGAAALFAGALAQRLGVLHAALTTLLAQHQPEAVVLEMLYTHQQHVTTAAIMAHARGIACLATEQRGIPLIEYSPNRVKQSITGHGTASKEQVARMVAQWLGQRDASWSFDATDALALAIAHAQMAPQQAVVG